MLGVGEKGDGEERRGKAAGGVKNGARVSGRQPLQGFDPPRMPLSHPSWMKGPDGGAKGARLRAQAR